MHGIILGVKRKKKSSVDMDDSNFFLKACVFIDILLSCLVVGLIYLEEYLPEQQ